MKFTGLYQKGEKGTFQIRLRVPEDVREAYGKTEFNRSLRTNDEMLAKEKYLEIVGKLYKEWNQLRSPENRQVHCSKSAKDHYDKIIADDYPFRVRVFSEAKADQYAFWAGTIIPLPDDQFMDHLREESMALESALRHCFRSRIKEKRKESRRALELGDRSSYPEEFSDSEVKNLIRAEIAAYDKLLSQDGEEPNENVQYDKDHLLSVLADKWIAESTPHWKNSMTRSSEATLQEFKSIVGDRSIDLYEKKDIRKYKNVLAKLPANITKKSGFRSLSLEDAARKAEKQGLKPMSPKTANKRLGILSAFFKWVCTNYDARENNPVEGFKLKEDSNVREERHSFTIDELNTIFSAPIYTGCNSPRYWKRRGDVILNESAKYWVPLIGLFTGMRLGEIIQLYKSDIKKDEGIYYFSVCPSPKNETGPDTKTLKNPSSERKIPIHRELLKIGILEFVNTCYSKRLFQEFKRDQTDSWSGDFTKYFRKFLNSLELNRTKTSFHSLRHSFADACKNSGVTEEVIKDLLGHAQSGQMARYGQSHYVITLNSSLQNIEYKGLNLDHLKS